MASPGVSTPDVELRGIGKRFGSFRALEDVWLRVRPGSIVGVVGENGAGKSTAMKILFGLLGPTEGEIWIDGKPTVWKTPQDAIRRGIGMVHQHFMLAGPYSVLDNILLGAEPSTFAWSWLPRALRPIDRKRACAVLQPWVERYAPGLDLDASVETLPVGLQQKVEILKLLYRDARVLILDEPTAVLTPSETDELFEQLRSLRQGGRSIVIITHKLREVLALTDEVMVLRGGRTVASFSTPSVTEAALAEAMVGREMDLGAIAARPRKRMEKKTAPIVQLEGLTISERGSSGRRLLGPLGLSVFAGEIVGIAGVNGNGQSELVHFLAGVAHSEWKVEGSALLCGEPVGQVGSTPVRARPVGVVPEDRHEEALLLDASVAENVLLGHQRSPLFKRDRFGLPWIHWPEVQRTVGTIISEFDVRPAEPKKFLREFSGGNQQKVVLGREISAQPRFLLVAQPTRGVDVGAIEIIHDRILRARDEGAAVLLVSSELDEVLALSDRVLVLYQGQKVAEQSRSAFDRSALGLAMGGVVQ